MITICKVIMKVYERSLISEVVTLLNLVHVMPSANAVCERSFSAMRSMKTYLSSTIKHKRLNYSLPFQVNKDMPLVCFGLFICR